MMFAVNRRLNPFSQRCLVLDVRRKPAL